MDANGDIAWVTDFPSRYARSKKPAYHTVSNSRHQFRLGRVRLHFAYGQLAPREVLAICTDDRPVDPDADPLPVLIGLADVMNGRSLLLQVSADGQQWAATLSEP